MVETLCIEAPQGARYWDGHMYVGGAQFQRMLDVTLQTDQQLFFDRSARLYSQPAMSWKTMPEVMIGVIPNSMRVPLFEAIIALSQ